MIASNNYSYQREVLVYWLWLGLAPLLIMLLGSLWPAYAAVPASARTLSAFAELPLAFEPNRGQADAGARFLARGAGYGLTLNDRGAELTLSKRSMGNARITTASARAHAFDAVAEKVVVRMTWEGANPQPRSHGEALLPGTSSYFIGQDPAQWHTAIPNFSRVRYAQVYPGIDLVYYGVQRQLEYDFIVAPGADPNHVQLRFKGVESLVISESGDLVLQAGGSSIRQHKPVVYQMIDGLRREVAGRYARVSANQVKFEIGDYDNRHELIIDPVLAYSTYFGNGGDDSVNGMTVDSSGNVYVAGTSHLATDQVFVSKISASGASVLYTAYIGDPNCDSFGTAVKVDASGNAHVTGRFGTVDQWGYCNMKYAFVSKLNPTGTTFVYSQAFGQGGDDHGNEIALDSLGNAYITGRTEGGWPVTANAYSPQGGFPGDAFILKLAPNGSMLYSTYLGNQTLAEGYGIAVDAQNNIYVTGKTQSATQFPVTANAFQTVGGNPAVTCFITKMNAAGSALLYSTYFGGERGEACSTITVDASGKIYVAGSTNSYNFPTTAGAYDRSCGTDGACNPYLPCVTCSYLYAEDAFVAKFDPTKSGVASLLYSTFIGAENRDMAHAIAVDSAGNCYVAGGTYSHFFPTQNANQTTTGGDHDAFIVQLNPTGSALLWSTYMGGAGWDEARAMALDTAGNLYVAGRTNSTNFPTRTPLQATNAGGYDAFVAKYGAAATPNVTALVLAPATINSGATSTATVTLSAVAPTGGVTVTLASSNTAAATAPATIVVPQGSSTANFVVMGGIVNVNTAAFISATAGGVTKTASLIVQAPISYVLTVTKAGTGTGTISSNPAGINCGADCTEPYASGSAVTLSAVPAAGATFVGWSGGCTGTGSCTVMMTADQSVTATFSAPTLPTVTLSTPIPTATEFGAVAGKFTITRTGSTAADLVVAFTVAGTATVGVDYIVLPTSVTIPSGAASASVLVTPIDDTLPEPNETVIVTLSTSASYTLGAAKKGTVTIRDNDTVVTIAATKPTATEAGLVPGQFTVTRVGYAATALTVLYSVSGTASKGIDYVALSGRVIIPAGLTSATISVTPINDTLVEGNESVVVTLAANSAYRVGATRAATVTITSDE